MDGIDKYAKVEKMLSDYKMMKINIVNMEKEIEYLKDQDGITGISCEGGGGGSGEFNSVTERTAFFNIQSVEELECKIEKAKLDVDKLDRALDGLTETERAIVVNKYIDGLRWWEVAYSVGYSESHSKAIRKQAISKLVIGVLG